MAEALYRYRGRDLTYEQFVDGPGSKMTTAELENALDRATGATRNRRSLAITMGRSGYKKVEKPGDRTLYFAKDGEEISFASYGEVERFLLEKGLIIDEKEIAAKKAAEKKNREKARKEAAKKKEAEKLAAKKAADKEKALKKKEAEKAKAAAKKAEEKKKEAEKKAAEKEAAKKTAQKKKETSKKPVPGRKRGRPAKAEGASKGSSSTGKVGRTAEKKAVTSAKASSGRGRKKTVQLPKMLQSTGFVIKIGRREFTQERLKGLALDSYRYDMGKDPRGAKVELYVKADEKKCIFIVNGKDRGEFDL